MNIVMASLAELICEYFSLSQLASEIAASVIVFAFAIVVGWTASFLRGISLGRQKRQKRR